jgi:hypothetical protein
MTSQKLITSFLIFKIILKIKLVSSLLTRVQKFQHVVEAPLGPPPHEGSV